MARPSPQSVPVTDTDTRPQRTEEADSRRDPGDGMTSRDPGDDMSRHDPGEGITRRRPGDSPISEDLLVRNYDVERRYTLHVTAEDPGSGTAFEWTYYLDPGEFRSEIGVLDPGTYEITVETESCGRDSESCTVGPDPDGTVLIETGNLTVAVSNEVY